MRRHSAAALAVFILCAGALSTATVGAATPTAELRSRVENGALLYFLETSNAVTGLTLDKARHLPAVSPATAALLATTIAAPETIDHVASIASTGFSLAVITHAGERGLIPRAEAYAYALKTLRFARDHVPRRHGWFAHFVDARTGERVWRSEYSTIDTALFVAGALYAGAIYPGSEVAGIADALHAEMDFEELRTDGGRQPKKLTLSMGITDEGYIPTQWDMYAEQSLLLILGLGHPTRPLPAEAWLAFSREQRDGLMGHDQALFTHQYSQLYLDFRGFNDGFPNYFDNSVRVTLRHRALARGDATSRTLRAGFWGFSAGTGPADGYEVANAVNHAGNACIGCALASVMFTPREVEADLARWSEGPYGNQIWGRYGLTDSIDLDRAWISEWALGITVGPAYLSFANLDARTSIWRTFMQIPAIKKGMSRAARETPSAARIRGR